FSRDWSSDCALPIFDVILLARRQADAAHDARLGVLHRLALFTLQEVDHGRMGVHHDGVARQLVTLAPQLTQYLVGDGGARLNVPGAVAVEARLVHRARQALAR